jgi:hypothetical protein
MVLYINAWGVRNCMIERKVFKFKLKPTTEQQMNPLRFLIESGIVRIVVFLIRETITPRKTYSERDSE